MTLKKDSEVNLQQLITRLLISYQPVAVNQKSFFINEVSPDLFIATDREVLSTLLGSLFYVVARCSRDTSITIKATGYENVTVVHIKDSGGSGNYSVLHKFQHLQMLSEKIGGFLDISNQRDKQTISFSFRNNTEFNQTASVIEMKRA